jgi:hypothetical protein
LNASISRPSRRKLLIGGGFSTAGTARGPRQARADEITEIGKHHASLLLQEG